MNKPIDILVVDDDSANLESTVRFLMEAGYQARGAGTGAECLAMAADTPPRLILLNASLPDISSVEVCQRLKVNQSLPRPFVVLLSSSHASSDARAAGLEAGADEYLTRPASKRELLARVRTKLRIQQAEAALRESNEVLERMVATRTAQWEEANATLRKEIEVRKQAEESLARHAERLKILHGLDQAILAAQSPDAIAGAALQWMGKLIPFEHAVVADIDEHSGRITPLATLEPGRDLGRKGDPEPLPNSDLLGELLSNRLHHKKDQPGFLDAWLRPGRGCVWKHLLELPLLANGELVGVICLAAQREEGFSEEHRDIARETSDSLAITIQQARWFEKIAAHRMHLRALSLRLMEVQEAERRSIARELHDEIGQLLTGLRMSLELSDLSPIELDGAKAAKAEALSIIQDLTERVRQLSLDLRPQILDDLGLLAALEWHFKRFIKQTGIRVLFRHSSLPKRLPPQLETSLFRIVQESLTNVARHARATQTTVKLWVDEESVRMQVEDNGMGFKARETMESHLSSGLSGMRERSELLGGELIVESEPGLGTRLTVELPLRAEPETSSPLPTQLP